MTRKAVIKEYDGWFFKFVVHRTDGIFIPENSVSFHRTLTAARKAAQNYTHSSSYRPIIETHEASNDLLS